MDWGQRKKDEWLAYFPDDGETIEDATMIMKVYEASHAAKEAVEYDFGNRDGWERHEMQEFTVIVVSPDGEEFKFMGWHEPSVVHKVRRIPEAK